MYTRIHLFQYTFTHILGGQTFLDHISAEDTNFEVCIIDEAGQSTEPSTLIPLRYGCKRLVLVGDPRQLPPTVLSDAANQCGLGGYTCIHKW